MKSRRGLHANRFSSYLVLLIAVGLVFSSQVAWAQVLYGSVIGNVVDTTGGVIPGAEVSVVNTATNLVLATVTNESGYFLIRNVPDGNYTLRVQLAGFKEHIDGQVVVSVGNVTRRNVTLHLGEITEQITVRGSATVLQADTADLHAQLESKELRDLPLKRFRNYQSLIDLVPGSVKGEYWHDIMDSPERSLTRSVNGANPHNNNTRIDGAQSVNIWLPNQSAYVPPAETIEVVNVSTNNFNAEVGFAGGAAITVMTKSGTNELRGSIFYHHENSALNARDFFNFVDQDGDGKADPPAGRRHFWGLTVGGPIIRSKLFFFAGFEALQQAQGATATSTLPTAHQRQGDFSEFLPESAGGSCVSHCTEIYDPLTGNPDGTGKSPFAGNIIPQERMSSPALKMQSLLPQTTRPGFVSNHEVSGQQVMNRFNADFKVDWYRSDEHRIWGKFSRMDAAVEADPRFGEAGGEAIGARLTGEGVTDTLVYGIGHNWSLSPNLLIDGNLGYTDRDQEVLAADFDKGNFGADVLGIPGTNLAPGQEKACIVGGVNRCAGIPAFYVSGFTGFGGVEPWSPIFRDENSLTFTHNFSWTNGNHEMRWGYDLVKHMFDHWQPELGGGSKGEFGFRGTVTGQKGEPLNENNAWADFLLGYPSRYMRKGLQWELMTANEWQHALYFRDRWQVTPQLTLTLGVRWEYYPLVTRDNREMEYLDLETIAPCSDFEPSSRCFQMVLGNNIKTSKRLFAPRLGFAYRLTDRDVLRSGYGITFSPIPFARPLRGFYPLTIGARFQPDDVFVPDRSLEEGIPVFLGPETSPGAKIPLPPYVLQRTMPPDKITRGYIQSWNLAYERRLPSDFVLSLAYVGTQTTHQLADHDLNWSAPGKGTQGAQLYPMRTTTTGYWDGWLSSNYHSLQVAVNRRFVGGLFVKGAYTWGRAINMTDAEGWAGLSWNAPELIHRNRAQSYFSRPHILQLATIYEPDWGQASSFWNRLVREWQFTGVFSLNSHPPATAFSVGNLNALGNAHTADQVKPEVKVLGGVGPGDPYLDPDAFAPVFRVPGRDCTNHDCYGSAGRNIIRGPAWVNLDFSLFRQFAITERTQLEFRSEFFNLTNTPHFSLPTQVAGSSSFMQITRTSPSASQRVIRFGLKLMF